MEQNVRILKAKEPRHPRIRVAEGKGQHKPWCDTQETGRNVHRKDKVLRNRHKDCALGDQDGKGSPGQTCERIPVPWVACISTNYGFFIATC